MKANNLYTYKNLFIYCIQINSNFIQYYWYDLDRNKVIHQEYEDMSKITKYLPDLIHVKEITFSSKQDFYSYLQSNHPEYLI